MKVTYIHHSGYAVELDKCILIFDYYKEDMPDYVLDAIYKGTKDVFFFSSHAHADHFNPEIFKYSGRNVYFIISHDIEEKVVYRGWLDDYPEAMVEYIRAGECMTVQGGNGSYLDVETLKSTDRGVAFIVMSEGQSVYHAGDLNNWIFDGMDKAKFGDMKARYTREIDKIKRRKMDVAFLPVDYRLGEYYAEGPAYFLESVDVKHVFPMHMWKEYGYIEKFRNEPRIAALNCTVYDANESGKSWKI